MLPPKRVLYSPVAGKETLCAIDFGPDRGTAVLSSAGNDGIRTVEIETGKILTKTTQPEASDPRSLGYFVAFTGGAFCLGGDSSLFYAGKDDSLKFIKCDLGLKIPKVLIAGSIAEDEVLFFTESVNDNLIYKYKKRAGKSEVFFNPQSVRNKYSSEFVGSLSTVAVCAVNKCVAFQLDQRLGVLDATGRLVSIDERRNFRTSAAFSPNGKYLVSANTKLMLHNPISVVIDKASPVFYSAGEREGLLSSLSMSSEPALCVAAINGHNTSPGDVIVWDVVNWKQLLRFRASSCPILQTKIHPNGGWMITSDAKGEVIAWDLRHLTPTIEVNAK